MADVYANPTYEDNYPTTNLEAIACGTPVVTYATGGSPESARLYGLIVRKGDISAFAAAIPEALLLRDSYDPTISNSFSCKAAVCSYLCLYNNFS